MHALRYFRIETIEVILLLFRITAIFFNITTLKTLDL